MLFAIHEIRYKPDVDVVTVSVVPVDGPVALRRTVVDLYTSQTALTTLADGGVWGDDEIRTAVNALLKDEGASLRDAGNDSSPADE